MLKLPDLFDLGLCCCLLMFCSLFTYCLLCRMWPSLMASVISLEHSKRGWWQHVFVFPFLLSLSYAHVHIIHTHTQCTFLCVHPLWMLSELEPCKSLALKVLPQGVNSGEAWGSRIKGVVMANICVLMCVCKGCLSNTFCCFYGSTLSTCS